MLEVRAFQIFHFHHDHLSDRFMLKELGEACLVSVKILLQHMCMRVPDKAEYRTKAAQVALSAFFVGAAQSGSVVRQTLLNDLTVAT